MIIANFPRYVQSVNIEMAGSLLVASLDHLRYQAVFVPTQVVKRAEFLRNPLAVEEICLGDSPDDLADKQIV